MKILTYPRATSVAITRFDIKAFDTHIKDIENLSPIESIDPKELEKPVHTDILPMMAGKLCYLSFLKGKGRNSSMDHLGHIIEVAHGSVMEHSNISFLISTSRSVTHELVRHRAGTGFSQLSQRYVNDPKFLIPFEYRSFISTNSNDPEIDTIDMGTIHYFEDSPLATLIKHCNDSYNRYNKTAEQLRTNYTGSSTGTELRKIVNQAARELLPNCTLTHIVATANVRAWRNIVEQRCSSYADVKIREVFNQVYDCLKLLSPASFQDYTKTNLPDGTFSINTKHPKI